MGLFSKSKTKPFLQEIEDRRTISIALKQQFQLVIKN